MHEPIYPTYLLLSATTMADLHFSVFLLISIILPLLFFIFRNPKSSAKTPTSYPILGSFPAIWKNKHRSVQWISDILTSTPNLTFTLHRPFGYRQMFTANAANVQHILKSNFHNYPKGDIFRRTLRDFLGDGIFNSDGESWKFQRQVSSHQFNTKSLRQFVEHVVDTELSERLLPILQNAAANDVVLDLQDILQRFAFDNICKIAFGYDPAYLQPSFPETDFAVAFDRALKLISERFNSSFPFLWKIKRFLLIGKEKELHTSVEFVRHFAKNIIKSKKQNGIESEDLLSRFLNSGHSDENFVTDVVINFILAGRDTTSAALTWFFWLISKNPEAEMEILKEIEEHNDFDTTYDEVRNMVYTHASLCESMRLYPPVPVSTKWAGNDDVLPDGSAIKKGTRISYHPYAMGRVEKVWGGDWAEFRPGRWLEREEGGQNWRFVGRDAYSYAVFQGGPRVCLGKDMALLQMKRVSAGVLRRFKVVPADKGVEAEYVSDFTTKMKGGFLVKIEERVDHLHFLF